MRAAEREAEPEKRVRVEEGGSWEDIAERLKRRRARDEKNPEPTSVEAAKVQKVPEERFWGDAVDETMEERMSRFVVAEMSDETEECEMDEPSPESADGWAWGDAKNSSSTCRMRGRRDWRR